MHRPHGEWVWPIVLFGTPAGCGEPGRHDTGRERRDQRAEGIARNPTLKDNSSCGDSHCESREAVRSSRCATSRPCSSTELRRRASRTGSCRAAAVSCSSYPIRFAVAAERIAADRAGEDVEVVPVSLEHVDLGRQAGWLQAGQLRPPRIGRVDGREEPEGWA
jgi:hypothetical protein